MRITKEQVFILKQQHIVTSIEKHPIQQTATPSTEQRQLTQVKINRKVSNKGMK